jgi:hypothetical protein
VHSIGWRAAQALCLQQATQQIGHVLAETGSLPTATSGVQGTQGMHHNDRRTASSTNMPAWACQMQAENKQLQQCVLEVRPHAIDLRALVRSHGSSLRSLAPKQCITSSVVHKVQSGST